MKSKMVSYVWDEERGVVALPLKKSGNDCQAIQLLHGPASMNFRRRCGLLLVDALNNENYRAIKPMKGKK